MNSNLVSKIKECRVVLKRLNPEIIKPRQTRRKNSPRKTAVVAPIKRIIFEDDEEYDLTSIQRKVKEVISKLSHLSDEDASATKKQDDKNEPSELIEKTEIKTSPADSPQTPKASPLVIVEKLSPDLCKVMSKTRSRRKNRENDVKETSIVTRKRRKLHFESATDDEEAAKTADVQAAVGEEKIDASPSKIEKEIPTDLANVLCFQSSSATNYGKALESAIPGWKFTCGRLRAFRKPRRKSFARILHNRSKARDQPKEQAKSIQLVEIEEIETISDSESVLIENEIICIKEEVNSALELQLDDGSSSSNDENINNVNDDNSINVNDSNNNINNSSSNRDARDAENRLPGPPPQSSSVNPAAADLEDEIATVIFDENFHCSEPEQSNKEVREEEAVVERKDVVGTKDSLNRVRQRRKKHVVLDKKRLGRYLSLIRQKELQFTRKKPKLVTPKKEEVPDECAQIIKNISSHIREIHNSSLVIDVLRKDMDEFPVEGTGPEFEGHFKFVISAQYKSFRKRMLSHQAQIMEGYDKLIALSAHASDVSKEISKEAFMSVDEVNKVISRCIHMEGISSTLEKRKSVTPPPTNEEDTESSASDEQKKTNSPRLNEDKNGPTRSSLRGKPMTRCSISNKTNVSSEERSVTPKPTCQKPPFLPTTSSVKSRTPQATKTPDSSKKTTFNKQVPNNLKGKEGVEPLKAVLSRSQPDNVFQYKIVPAKNKWNYSVKALPRNQRRKTKSDKSSDDNSDPQAAGNSNVLNNESKSTSRKMNYIRKLVNLATEHSKPGAQVYVYPLTAQQPGKQISNKEKNNQTTASTSASTSTSTQVQPIEIVFDTPEVTGRTSSRIVPPFGQGDARKTPERGGVNPLAHCKSSKNDQSNSKSDPIYLFSPSQKMQAFPSRPRSADASNPDALDPTVPQKLTLINSRLSAGGAMKVKTPEPQQESCPPPQTSREEQIKSIVLKYNAKGRYTCAKDDCQSRAVQVCGECLSICYCGFSCQINHWYQQHKYDCAVFKDLRGHSATVGTNLKFHVKNN